MIVAQIFVDYMNFTSTSENGVYEFVDQMKNEFEISMMGELSYFRGL